MSDHARIRPLGLRDLLAVGTFGLRIRPLRAILSTVGIAIAIATVVVVTGIPASSQAALDARLTALGSDLMRVDPLPSDTPITLPTRSIGMLDRIGPVDRAATVANVHASVRSSAYRSSTDSGVTTLAVSGPLLTIVHGRLASGRFLDPGVLPTVVLGSDAAAGLGLPRLPDRTVTIDVGGVPFAVVGVLAPTPLSADLQSSVLISSAAAEKWLGYDGRPTVAYLTAEEEAIPDLGPIVAETLSPAASGLVQVSRPSDVLAAKQATTTAFSGLALGLAAVALVVGGIGIANTMFVSVLERRREIGLRRSLGAHRGQIRAQFLLEAVTLCLLGGAAGLVLGGGATAGWAVAHDWPVVIPLTTIALSAAASVVVGALAGLVPSMRAARQSPTSALASV